MAAVHALSDFKNQRFTFKTFFFSCCFILVFDHLPFLKENLATLLSFPERNPN